MTMIGLHFLRPYMFLSLAALLPLASLFWYMGFQLRAKTRKAYGEEPLVGRFSQPLRIASEATILGAWLAAIFLTVVAAAGPAVPDAPTKVTEGSLQVVILSDVSKSMATEEYRKNLPPKEVCDIDDYGNKSCKLIPAEQVPGAYGTSLDMAKYVVEKQIMPAVSGNEIGIATYCGNGFDQADLTTDYKSLTWIMDHWMQIGAAPGGGSDYSEGLKETLIIFQNTPAPNKQKVIVWFTDGGFTGDQADLAKTIEMVRQAGVKVIIVGVGSDEPLPIPVYDENTGQLTGYMQKDDKTVTSHIDEAAMQNLASRLDGTYIRAVPGQDLNIHWASTLAGGHTEQHESQIYQYPLALALVLIFGLFVRGLLPARKREKKD
jgi:hypothetical protein